MSTSPSLSGQPTPVTTAGGVTLAACWHPPRQPQRGALLLLPAMAAPMRCLRQLAHHLADAGLGVLRADVRFTGESVPPPDRAHDATMLDLLEQDVPALLAQLARLAPGVPHACAGHSLGGQLAALALARFPQDVRAAVLLNVSLPHEALWRGRQKLAVASAFRVYPWLAARLGHLPARPWGMGVPIPATLTAEWGHWGTTGQYVSGGRDLRALLSSARGPLLHVGTTDDALFAPEPAMQAYLDLVPLASSTRWMFTPPQAGARTLGHFGLLRDPAAGFLAPRLAAWLADALHP